MWSTSQGELGTAFFAVCCAYDPEGVVGRENAYGLLGKDELAARGGYFFREAGERRSDRLPRCTQEKKTSGPITNIGNILIGLICFSRNEHQLVCE
jgi:hypothetical protein